MKNYHKVKELLKYDKDFGKHRGYLNRRNVVHYLNHNL